MSENRIGQLVGHQHRAALRQFALFVALLGGLVSWAIVNSRPIYSEALTPSTPTITAAVAAPDLAIGFSQNTLHGASLAFPTSLQFGPDGRLYVAQQSGQINAYTIVRSAPGQYTATVTETITLIQQIPNHNDDGSLAPQENERQVTGLLVTGSAQTPVIYVSSSDPRYAVANDKPPAQSLDTNSGIVSRLTRNGSSWTKVDLVRGLPRSAENHSVNGMALDQDTNTLYLMVGGNTNMGAPSTNFSKLAEYAYSNALLSIDLDAIGDTTYDLPTLDDEDRAGVNDANEPFGGNLGKNQAMIVAGGPVQLYATGWRNAYDVVFNQAKRLYTVDNGSNEGWGSFPLNCTNQLQDGGTTDKDSLHFISGAGYYGGHPNPTRGNRNNTFNSTNPQSPVLTANPTECTYLARSTDTLATFDSSTNGLAEYTASNFSGALQGNLLATSYSGEIWRLRLNAAGTALATPKEVLLYGFGTHTLDVTAQGDNEIFPGTIWAVTYYGSSINVFEPNDYDGAVAACTGVDNASLDEDDDGYDNADEIDNSTNPCSAGSVPFDFDNDLTSDLLDGDDDNDGRSDTLDLFAVDAQNGAATNLPVTLTWNNGDPSPGGLLGLGFTGLMGNETHYATLYDPNNVVNGGAAGVVTVIGVPSGTAEGQSNSQQYGLQLGVNVDHASSPFTIHTRLKAPFQATALADNRSMGIFFGTGDQDNYLKLVASANGGNGGVQLLLEQAGAVVNNVTFGTSAGVDIKNATDLDLMLHIHPGAALATASLLINGGERIDLGTMIALPTGWFSGVNKPAVGIIATSAGSTPFPASWDFLTVTPSPTTVGPTRLYLPVVTAGQAAQASSSRQTANRGVRAAALAVPAEPPFANAGADQVVVDVNSDGEQAVRLSAGGSGSGDVDSVVISYTWTSNSGVVIPDGLSPVAIFPLGVHTVTLTVRDDEDLVDTDTMLVTVIDANASGGILYRVNGGGDIVAPLDGSRVTWSADSYLTSSIYLSSTGNLRTYITATTITMDDPSLAGTGVTPEMFTVERYAESPAPGVQMTWDFPVPNGVELEIRLFMAEIWFDSDDARLFSVAAEGTTPAVFENINMHERWGADKAAMLKHRLIVTDGKLDLDFIAIVENPAIKAIEIRIASDLDRKNYLPVVLGQ